MLFDIRHITQYQYDEAVRESVMELWMQPRRAAGQRLISFELQLDPPAQQFSYADSYGNTVHHFDLPQPHQRVTITLGDMPSYKARGRVIAPPRQTIELLYRQGREKVEAVQPQLEDVDEHVRT